MEKKSPRRDAGGTTRSLYSFTDEIRRNGTASVCGVYPQEAAGREGNSVWRA